MTAGDVTITRGVKSRDDLLVTTAWTLDAGVTLTTDGDLGTFGGLSTTNGATTSGLSIDTNIYQFLAIRAATSSGPGLLRVRVTFSDASTQTFDITTGAGPAGQVLSFFPKSLTLGKTVNSLKILSQTAGPDAFVFDFVYFFKEQLTLPAVSEPVQLPLTRYVIEITVPTREGGILQDLGSSSPEVQLAGRLVSTAGGTNSYTGEQWWDVLVGVWLEANWQWFASDRIAYKYQITELIPVQNPGQVGYYGFKMRLRKVDILSATAQTFTSNTGGGAIQ